jgi:hypothetical protein
MTNKKSVQIDIQAEPLAMIFSLDDGYTTTARIDASTAIGLMVEFYITPDIQASIVLPRFLKRWFLSILKKAHQRARKNEWNANP